MARVKRPLLSILVILVAVLAVVLVVVSFSLGSIIKAGVNKFGPAITKTKVELAGARLSPLTGTGMITGLFIGNPPGWQSDKAIYLGEAQVSVVPTSLLTDHIVIKEVVVEKPEFVYETKLFSSNIRDLLSNIESATGGGAKGGESGGTKSGRPLKFEIREFVLRDGKVTIGAGARSVSLKLPALTLTDLGTKEGGITANQMAAVVTERVLDHVLATAASALTDVGKTSGADAANAASQTVKKAAEGIKKLLGD